MAEKWMLCQARGPWSLQARETAPEGVVKQMIEDS